MKRREPVAYGGRHGSMTRLTGKVLMVVLLAGLTACGNQGVDTNGAADSSPPVEDETAPVAEVDPAGLWRSFASGLEAAEEAEWYLSFEEMSVAADAIVVGAVVEIRAGRISPGRGSVPDLPFAEFVIGKISGSTGEPTREDGSFVIIEIPFAPNSPELTRAIEAAISGEAYEEGASDEQLARATNDEAIAEAFDKYYDDAIAQTIERMNADRPTVSTIFFLREVPVLRDGFREGRYRPVNGSGIIVDDLGMADLPLRSNAEADPVGKDVIGMTFSELVDRVFAS